MLVLSKWRLTIFWMTQSGGPPGHCPLPMKKLYLREAGPPNHHDDKVDSDQ